MPNTKLTKSELAKTKLAKIPVKIEKSTQFQRKPEWLKIDLTATPAINKLKTKLRDRQLVSVCEEASCPNLAECFGKGVATFMIMGEKCTRRCAFCDVEHGRPNPLDPNEPMNLAKTIAEMDLKYVVITSVDRDDLRDGGAEHFAQCIDAVRAYNPGIKVEILVPDFRSRMDKALTALQHHVPDVFNHNLETVPRLYRQIRPGSDYAWSLQLLQEFKRQHPNIKTKSGIMLGLGETNEEVIQVMRDMRAHDVDMITMGQYLQPTPYHMPVDRFVPPAEFDELGAIAKQMGFYNVASGPMVRSSYHADQQAHGDAIK